jgi:hypothetical protein
MVLSMCAAVMSSSSLASKNSAMRTMIRIAIWRPRPRSPASKDLS